MFWKIFAAKALILWRKNIRSNKASKFLRSKLIQQHALWDIFVLSDMILKEGREVRPAQPNFSLVDEGSYDTHLNISPMIPNVIV